MNPVTARVALASLGLFSPFLYATAQELTQSTTVLTPISPGLYSIPSNSSSEPIIVSDNHACHSNSSGWGTVIRAEYRTGILCLSALGYAYVNVAKGFSMSSLTSGVQAGIYGPSSPFANGMRQQVIVLPDVRQCVFNPTFDKTGAWTGQSDNGKTDRRGLTVLNTNKHIICLSPVNDDLAEYIPDKNVTFLLTSVPGYDNHHNDPAVLVRQLSKTIIDAIYPADEFRPLTQAVPQKQGLLLDKLPKSGHGYVKVSGRKPLLSDDATGYLKRAMKRDAYGGPTTNPIWAGAIAYGTGTQICDPRDCAGISNCTIGVGANKCSVSDYISTDIENTDYDMDVDHVQLPTQAVCQASAAGQSYQVYAAIWGGLGGFQDNTTLQQSGVFIYYNCQNSAFSARTVEVFYEAINGATNFNQQMTMICSNTHYAFSGESSDVAPTYETGTITIEDTKTPSCGLKMQIMAPPGYAIGNEAEGVSERTQTIANYNAKNSIYQQTLHDVYNTSFFSSTYDATGEAEGPYFNDANGNPATFNISAQPIATDYDWSYNGMMFDVSLYEYLRIPVDSCDLLVGSAMGSSVLINYTYQGNPNSSGQCF